MSNLSMIWGMGMNQRVPLGSLLNPFPVPSLQSFASDLTVIEVEGSYYFKALKGDNLLITGYDFPAGWTKGFPYKSAATIDIFGLTGVPVVSLFQNFDYGNQYFCKHVAQVVDGNGVETSEPYVSAIVAYSEALTDANLTAANTFFNVPVENTATSVWVSESGNDTTGNGTKALPYKTLDKVKATTKEVIYIKSGSYTQTAMLTLTGAAVQIIGTGNAIITTWAGLIGIQNNRDTIYSGVNLITNASNYGVYSNGGTITFNRVRYSAAADKGYISAGVAKSLVVNNSVFSGYIIEKGSLTTTDFNTCILSGLFSVVAAAYSSVINSKILNALTPSSITTFIGNTITGNVNIAITNCNYNKITGNVSNTLTNFIGNTVVGQINANSVTTFNNNNITGNITSTFTNFKNNIVTGTTVLTAIDNLDASNNSLTYLGANEPLKITAAANANRTGVKVNYNQIFGNRSDRYVVYIGTTSNEEGANSINGLEFIGNKVSNAYVGTGNCHTVFIGGGINPKVKYNDVTASNGYAYVIKSGGITYTTTDSHFAYNIIRCTGSLFYGFLVKTALGVIVANNTLIDYIGGSPFGEDTGTVGSALFINNHVELAGNTTSLSTGDEHTSRNNTINKNGFTCSLGANDFEVSIMIDSNGVPASKIEHAETVTGDNNTGLDSNYVIPSAITYQNQGETWQNGAVILP